MPDSLIEELPKIVLISCTSRKREYKTKAKYLYDRSPLFRKSLEYARLLNPAKIFILSAKYELLDLEREIEPYDITLSNVPKKVRTKKPNLKILSKEERKIWSKNVINQLNKKTNLKRDMFIFLAGRNYREFLVPHITNYNIPMEHIKSFYQQGWLTKEISKLRNKNE